MEATTMTKWQISELYGFGSRMLSRRLKQLEDELLPLGYTRKSKVLAPSVVEVIFRSWGNPKKR